MIKNADEILDNMARQLKVASVVEDFKQELQKADTEKKVDAVYNKYRSALRRQITQQDWEALCNARKKQIKKSAFVNIALQKIIEAADIFDKVGFETYASDIDSLISKITYKEVK